MGQPDPVDVLAFGPHPDDVELCAGGWMLKLRNQGRRVAVVDFTRGEGGSRGDAKTREREAAAASEIMGLVGRENLGLPDTAVRATPEALELVTASIRRWRPKVVVGPSPQDLHPDHVAAAGLLQQAYYLSTIQRAAGCGLRAHRPDALIHYYGHKEPPPTFVVDVSDVWEERDGLVRCFASQFGLDGKAGARTNISSPDFFRRMEARFAYWGARIGAAFAEPFLADRVVPLDDPVEVFAKRGWAVL